jgi:hypothetical protein
MKKIFAILTFSVFTIGCSFAIRGELLNPLNLGGRIETSRPTATPTPSPTPSPTPEAYR